MDWITGLQQALPVPAHTYAVFETERCAFPTMIHLPLRKQIATEWLPSSGYLLADAPEISVIHWYRKPDDSQRYIEHWIPVVKK